MLANSFVTILVTIGGQTILTIVYLFFYANVIMLLQVVLILNQYLLLYFVLSLLSALFLRKRLEKPRRGKTITVATIGSTTQTNLCQ
ncbi:unnamed protein product, partial [Mesorhabditis belari]|uniref:Uncharacterized protein n=1 Tax=Mesorhabditis belari TaxID=2138241 RepID=A0AAF3EMR1_9BILA